MKRLLWVGCLVLVACGDDASGVDGGARDADGADTSTRDATTDSAVADAADAAVSDAGVDAARDSALPDVGDAAVDSRMSFFVTSNALGCPDGCTQCGYEFDDNDIDENDGRDCSSGSGNLGGLAGADAHCQALALSVGAGGRVWRAYLSITPTDGVSAVNARDRIGAGPWFNAAGVMVASDVDNLHTLTPGGEFGDAINNITALTALTERGDRLRGIVERPDDGDHDILTGSQNDGMAYPRGSDRTCRNWTSTSARVRVGHPDRDGLTGPGNDSLSWNSAHNPSCSAAGLDGTAGAGYFYCFAAD